MPEASPEVSVMLVALRVSLPSGSEAPWRRFNENAASFSDYPKLFSSRCL